MTLDIGEGYWSIWMFPKIGVFTPQNGWFIMENPIKMDDLGVPLFLETPIFCGTKCHPEPMGCIIFKIRDLPNLKMMKCRFISVGNLGNHSNCFNLRKF